MSVRNGMLSEPLTRAIEADFGQMVVAMPKAPSGTRVVRAAQYLGTSKEHQTYWIGNQEDAIRDYAM
ncbi:MULTISPECIES: hypothetical protein [unclassified Mesorhizobium]|uniref:hypothetical protein n=2 Tax=unclassified Mesorhizobium TaxID=325217 RepID=UPI0015CC713F